MRVRRELDKSVRVRVIVREEWAIVRRELEEERERVRRELEK